MYIRVNNQRTFLQKAINKAGSQRRLVKIINIPKSSIHRYINGEAIPESRFEILVSFLDVDNTDVIVTERLDDNFRQVLGGKKCVLVKKEKGTFKRDMTAIQRISSKRLKLWHKNMKNTRPMEYYQIQYSRFKKIYGYKFISDKGEKVRNVLEKIVADNLYRAGVKYDYEPLVRADKKYFFPDFLVGNKIIIECTFWNDETKAHKLKKKIRHLEKNYKVFVVVPRHLFKYYKAIKPYLVAESDGRLMGPGSSDFFAALKATGRSNR